MKSLRKPSQRHPWVLALMLTALFTGCADDNGGGTFAPGIGPTITQTAPARADTNVPINRNITATFSEAMDTASVTTDSFTVQKFGAAAVIAGSVSMNTNGTVATFSPTAPLETKTPYSVIIDTGVKSFASGSPMEMTYTWSFETGQTGDTSSPLVIATGEYGNSGDTSGATGLPVNRASTVTFNEVMDANTLVSPATTFTLEETLSGNPVTGVVTYIGATAVFTPDSNLLLDTEYTSTVSVIATDLANNALATPYVWSWSTGSAVDNTPPTITVTNPADLLIDVPLNQTINAGFSEPMNPATLIASNVVLKETVSNNVVPGSVSYDIENDIATFVPDSDLLPDTDYTMSISTSTTDLAANNLIVPAVGGLPVPNPWTFRTAALPVPLAINLRGIAPFGIASRAGLTSTGVTVINGDVALYPTPTCTDSTGNAGASQTCLVQVYASPTGMTVNGSIYWFGDAFDNGGTANSVTNDLNIAWVEGKDKVPTMPTVAGNELSSATDYLPGVYHNPTLGMAAGGVATMDAQNDPTSVFIFQVDASFVDSGTLLLPTEIVLKNGAKARNIWFIVGSDVTIGNGSIWHGNILAGGTATVNSGSTVVGRILAGAAGAGAITLTGAASPSVTTITVPE